MTQYSNRTLLQKLDIRQGFRLIFLNPPRGYKALLGKLPSQTKVVAKLGTKLDFIHLFALTVDDVKRSFPKLKKSLKKDGMLWVSWPKGKKLQTDLREDIIRLIGLKHGLVDVKVIAIDDTWSGLKFIFRFADR